MNSSVRGTPNRLVHETSPYLKQHAYNPVDWHPWGDVALAAARAQDRPIFLSIGYSACHWCHVMERESFENAAIAAAMNERFINIKVDREERPDLDQIYMTAVQLMTGRGGWPMSVFLTPDMQPFFGGTYWPPEPRMGMPGFHQVLLKVSEAWRDRQSDVRHSAHELTAAVRELAAGPPGRAELSDRLIQQSMQKLISIADRRYGGFGGAPKFPHAMDLRVLLRAWQRFGDEEALAVCRLTLDRMAQGGLYDQLGGGFHRYSTDERWLAPHFEKMLYDNALLTPVYLEAFQSTGDVEYARIARETLDYVLREMQRPNGGFYSTQDADSEGEEGKFFVWTEAEIDAVLDAGDAPAFKAAYDVTPRGNWEGRTILNRPRPWAELTSLLNLPPAELAAALTRCRAKLLDTRSARVHPGRDEKILTSWNGMMISALAQGAQVLNEPRYAVAAQAAADFLHGALCTGGARLQHAFKDGQARINGFLDDYACLIDGLVDLYQATFASRQLEWAVELAEVMCTLFSDDAGGGFFYTPSDHESLITRNKENHDGSTPSGNSMAATALLRLGRLCGRADFEIRAQATLEILAGVLVQSPTAGGQALLALDFFLGPTREMALIAGDSAAEVADVLRAIHRRFLPNKVIALRPPGAADAAISPVLQPLLQGRPTRGGAATLYICEHGRCGLPAAGVEQIARALG